MIESRQMVEHLEEYVLRHLLGIFGRDHNARHERVYRVGVAVDQHGEGFGVAAGDTFYEVVFLLLSHGIHLDAAAAERLQRGVIFSPYV